MIRKLVEFYSEVVAAVGRTEPQSQRGELSDGMIAEHEPTYGRQGSGFGSLVASLAVCGIIAGVYVARARRSDEEKLTAAVEAKTSELQSRADDLSKRLDDTILTKQDTEKQLKLVQGRLDRTTHLLSTLQSEIAAEQKQMERTIVQSVPILIAGLEHERTQLQALKTIDSLPFDREKAVPAVLKLLTSKSPQVRAKAAESLGNWAEPTSAVMNAVAKGKKEDTVADVRSVFQEALFQLEMRKAVANLDPDKLPPKDKGT
jgi:hypothetical protein